MGICIVKIATEFEVVRINIPTDIQAKVDHMVANRICLGCKEVIPVKGRRTKGLCGACYEAARVRIKKNRRVRARMIKDGEMLGEDQRGRKHKNEFTKRVRQESKAS